MLTASRSVIWRLSSKPDMLPSFSVVQPPPSTSWQPVWSHLMISVSGMVCFLSTLSILEMFSLVISSKSLGRCLTACVPFRLTNFMRRSSDLAKLHVIVMCKFGDNYFCSGYDDPCIDDTTWCEFYGSSPVLLCLGHQGVRDFHEETVEVWQVHVPTEKRNKKKKNYVKNWKVFF